MKRRVLAVTVSAALIAASFVLPGAPARAAAKGADLGGTIKAGYGVADATWHVGAGAGQYAAKSPQDPATGLAGGDIDPHSHSVSQKDSYGVESRLSFRTVLVEDAEGDQVAFVKSDNYLAQDALQRRASQILAEQGSNVSYDEIMHMASHNHFSPYYSSPSWGVWLFQDAYDIRAFEYQARAMAESIRNAELALQPAQMGATEVNHYLFKGMVARRTVTDDGTPGGYPLDFGDFGLPVVRFEALDDGAPIAALINWGMHPEGAIKADNLITAEFLAPLERFVERATGAPLVFGQGDVGSAESGPARPYEFPDGIFRQWDDAGHAQIERGAYLLAQDVIRAWNDIGSGNPLVPFDSDFDVAAGNAFIPGPLSHPYPSVSNCKTSTTTGGAPGAPVAGVPDCERGDQKSKTDLIWENLKAHGIPVPDHYDAPAFTGVEENLRLRLQAFKLGEVIFMSCACEAQVDLILNLESRTNEVQGDQYLGYDWTKRLDCVQANAPTGDWTCTRKADDPAAPGATFGSLTFTDAEHDRMLAQIYNDARGWDEPDNIVAANSEPADTTKIWGNFTHEELSPELGYKLPIGVGHAGDYNGYTVSYREYMAYDHYRKALTSYGPHTADYMNTTLMELARELNDGDADNDYDFRAQDESRAAADEARQQTWTNALGQTSESLYDQWRASLQNDKGPAAATGVAPRDIKRFDSTTFSWRGGSNAVDNPTVEVQRLVDGEWKFFADQSGEIQTKVQFPKGVNGFATTYAGNQEWIWTANFEAFNAFPAGIGSTPAGEYRFVVDGLIRQAGQDSPYHLESESFEVSPWNGVTVQNLALNPQDGSVSFSAESTYPEIDESAAFPYVRRKIQSETDKGELRSDERRSWCVTCSFRPWATSGTLESAQITIVHGDGGHSKRAADCEGNVCTAPVGQDETAYIAAGDIVDNYGETNSQCYDFNGGNECPPAENDLDMDDDGVFNDADNCLDVANSDQMDADKDAAGDACDEDDTDGPDPDADGIRDRDDNCDANPNTNQSNVDGDEFGDACDPDSSDGPLADPDSDGISNLDEAAGGSDPRDACDPDDAAGNCDADKDGFVNATDNCDQDGNPGQADSDDDGIGDTCDPTPFPPVTGGGGTDGGGTGGSGQSSPPASSPPPGSNSPAAAERGTVSTSIAASVTKTDHGVDFTISGVVSGDRQCTFGTIEILKRTYGSDELVVVRSAQVAPDGAWSALFSSTRNASYAARPSASDLCDGQMSSPVDVLVRAKVIPRSIRCDVMSSLRGRVAPNLGGTKVALQRKTARGSWKRLDVVELNDRSRFVFRQVPSGCRATRVVWTKQDVRNERGVAAVSLKR